MSRRALHCVGPASLTVAVALAAVLVMAQPLDAAGARAALVMDAQTGRVLFSQNAAELMYPASITKIVTALVTRELSRPQEVVRVDPSAVGIEGSSIYLREGEELSVEDLLYGLLLESGNDAAQALAVHVAGDVTSFAELMTGRVRQAGGTGCVFQNPHGLPNLQHVVTARDMGIAATELLRYPLLREIVRTASYQIPWSGRDRGRTLHNHNRALGMDGVDGIKTGYTRASEHTFVGSATRDGHQLVAVVLDSTREGKFTTARTLLSEAFATHVWKEPPLDPHGAPVRVIDGESEYVDTEVYLSPVPLKNGETLKAVYHLVPSIQAPVEAGQQLGEVVVSVHGEVIYRAPVRAAVGVLHRGTWWNRWHRNVVRYFSRW